MPGLVVMAGLLAALSLAGCGQKGPLTLPSQKGPLTLPKAAAQASAPAAAASAAAR